MRLLLDTHVFLWFVTNDPRLPHAWQTSIVDPANEAFLSVVSLWEAIIKNQLGKLPLPAPAQTYVPFLRVQHQIQSLDLDEASVKRVALLPALHKDPFDRALICQAIEHGLVLVTDDPVVASYPVQTLPP
jgi:PIN domain nuclease of toxin-antitoxin system